MVPRKRQFPDSDPLPAPSAEGIVSDAITASSAESTATALAYDISASVTGEQSAPPLAVTADPTITITPTPDPTPPSSSPFQPTSSSTIPSAASAARAPITVSTVIVTCVGAFIVATAFIGLAFWLYRRYAVSLHKRVPRPRRRGCPSADSLEADDGQWEATYPTKEVDGVAPMEKLTMFKKTPSVRTAQTSKSDVPIFDPQSFAQYHPSIAESLASKARSLRGADASATLIIPRQSNAMTPSCEMAIPTPPIMQAHVGTHCWESAEVLHYDRAAAGNKRESPYRDPFANPGSEDAATTELGKSLLELDKGKTKALANYYDDNPFSDVHAPLSSTSLLASQSPTTSQSQPSLSSQDHAMQSLIAALGIPESEVQERLRVASMQPSVISEWSTCSEDIASLRSFPLPPTTCTGAFPPSSLR